MSTSLCNKKGITLIESVIAIMLVSIGLVGLMSMQPSAWQASTRTVNTSDQGAAQAGDINFTVTTTITNIATNVWRVTVRVSWAPLNPTGITESFVVTRQENFRFPSGCV